MTNGRIEYESPEATESANLTICTPEGVVVSIELAGPLARCMALTLDLILVYALLLVLKKFLSLIGILSTDIAAALSLVVYFVVTLGYHIFLEWRWQGQTFGKKLFRIRVIDLFGLRLGFSQILLRNLIRTVDILPFFYMCGGLSCSIDEKNRRLGDIAASTVVVKASNAVSPELDNLSPEKYNSFRAWPHIAARLRQTATPKEAALALKAILRRNVLRSEDRIFLFDQIADHFRSMAAFPEECMDGISDENYVRNAVELLYENSGNKKARDL